MLPVLVGLLILRPDPDTPQLAWQIPLAVLVAIGFCRLACAPYWMHEAVVRERDALRDRLTSLERAQPRLKLAACGIEEESFANRPNQPLFGRAWVAHVKVANEPTALPGEEARVIAEVTYTDDANKTVTVHGRWGDEPWLDADPRATIINAGVVRDLHLALKYIGDGTSWYAISRQSASVRKYLLPQYRLAGSPIIIRVHLRGGSVNTAWLFSLRTAGAGGKPELRYLAEVPPSGAPSLAPATTPVGGPFSAEPDLGYDARHGVRRETQEPHLARRA